MGSIINMYPILNEEDIKQIGYNRGDFELFYNENGEYHFLTLENIDGNNELFSGEIRDPKCEWYPEKYNLIIKRMLSFSHTNLLFGMNGIAPKNATIGVAVRWMSYKSERRGFVPIGSFDCDNDNLELIYRQEFNSGSLRGSIVLETVFYLKHAAKIVDDCERHLANKTGVILGVLDSCEIHIDGNGSVFPISTVSSPSKPLWWVYYDETCDPLTDPFDEEFVEIFLNRAHPTYNDLKIDEGIKNSPLFLEVISSALLIIINSTKDILNVDWNNVIQGQGFAKGSIAEAIYYFIDKLNWDINSTAKLSQSIRLFFDNNINEGSL